MAKTRKLKKWLLRILVILFLLVSLPIVFFFVYQDKIQQYVVTQISKNLTTKVTTSKVEITLFKDFPNVSASFSNITAIGYPAASFDTLLHLNNLYLSFDIVELLQSRYVVNQVSLNEGFVNIISFPNDRYNYEIFKTDTSSSINNNTSFQVDLNKVTLDKVKLRYRSISRNDEYDIYVDRGYLSGIFSDKNQNLKINCNGEINTFSSNNSTYFKNKKLEIVGEFTNNNTNNVITFNNLELLINKSNFLVNGRINYQNSDELDFDISCEGKNNSISLLSAFVPQEYLKYIDKYNIKADFNFLATIKDKYSLRETPKIEATFNFKNGEFKSKEDYINLKNMSFSGSYSNGSNKSLSSSVLKVNNLQLILNNKILNGSLTVQDFINYKIKGNIKGVLDAIVLIPFSKDYNISNINGTINLDNHFIYNKQNSKEQFSIIGEINSESINFNFKDEPNNNLSFNIKSTSDVIDIDKLSLKILSNDFDLSAQLLSLDKFLFNDDNLKINFSSKNNLLNINELIAFSNSFPNSDKKQNNNQIVNRIFINGTAEINKLIIDKQTFNNFKTEVSISDNIKFNNTSFEFCDGKFKTQFILNGIFNNSEKNVQVESSIENVDINKVFSALDNFNQTVITQKNIFGMLSTQNLTFSANLNEEFMPIEETIRFNSKIKIKNGRIKELGILMDAGKELNIKNLNDISFNTVTNNIKIENKTVFIPEMKLENSVSDITFAGSHTFDNKIDYNLKLNASDLIFGKKTTKDSEFGTIAKENNTGTFVYVKISGDVDNPIVKHDKNETLKGITKGIKESTIDIFKKDSTKKDRNKKEISTSKDGDYELEW